MVKNKNKPQQKAVVSYPPVSNPVPQQAAPPPPILAVDPVVPAAAPPLILPSLNPLAVPFYAPVVNPLPQRAPTARTASRGSGSGGSGGAGGGAGGGGGGDDDYPGRGGMPDLVLPDMINGPMEVGLAAAAGDGDDLGVALHLYPSTYATLACLPPLGIVHPRIYKMYVVMAVLVRARELYLYGGDLDGNVVPEALNPGIAPDADAPDQAFIDSITTDERNKGALLLLSTKVNMWQINHHTGQGAIQGFAAKAAALVFPEREISTADVTRMIWIAGHWVSTRGAFAAMGVTDLRAPNVGVFDGAHWPKPTNDIAIRIAAGPAGSARVMTHRSIVIHALRSAFAILLPPSDLYLRLVELDGAQRSATRHDGALYLTGRSKEELLVLEDDICLALAAYLHAVAPRHTLAAAKVIAHADAVRGSDVYIRITNVKAQVVAARSADVTMAQVRIMMGTASEDPVAAAAAAMAITRHVIPSEDEARALLATMAGSSAAAGAPLIV